MIKKISKADFLVEMQKIISESSQFFEQVKEISEDLVPESLIYDQVLSHYRRGLGYLEEMSKRDKIKNVN